MFISSCSCWKWKRSGGAFVLAFTPPTLRTHLKRLAVCKVMYPRTVFGSVYSCREWQRPIHKSLGSSLSDALNVLVLHREVGAEVLALVEFHVDLSLGLASERQRQIQTYCISRKRYERSQQQPCRTVMQPSVDRYVHCAMQRTVFARSLASGMQIERQSQMTLVI